MGDRGDTRAERRAARAERRLARAHAYARRYGINRTAYGTVRVLITPPLRLWFRMRVHGAAHVPPTGAALLAPNHKSFLDPFLIAIALPRPVRYMAKTEIFHGALLSTVLPRLGAFPVRRGAADAEALETARAILEQGELVVVFPEGTRVDDAHELGAPHHGAGRLAVETGAPIVPAAITGTDGLWLGPLPRPRRVQLTFLPPLDPAAVARSPDAARALVDDALWPEVQWAYERQLAAPGAVLAALLAAGVVGGLAARRRARARTRIVGLVEPRRLRRRRPWWRRLSR